MTAAPQRVRWLLWSLVAAGGSAAWAGKPPGADLLEFLGSVDSEDASWNQYLASTDLDRVANTGAAKTPAKAPAPAPAGAPAAKSPVPGGAPVPAQVAPVRAPPAGAGS